MKQQTIKNLATISGTGLHSGQKANITLKPAAALQGIVFVRVDLPNQPRIKVEAASVLTDVKVSRCTALQSQGVRIFTVEHLLAACSGLGIDNLIVEIDSEEVPGMDGSSQEFVNLFKKAGIVELEAEREVFEIKEPIVVASKTASLTIIPSPQFAISYTLDYDHPALRSQFFSIADVNQEGFEKDLASARTFCLDTEAQEIQARGLGKGANHENTLIMSAKGPLDNQLRFPDECARHKALDIVGDLFLLGYQVRGTVYGIKSGHSLNRELVKKIEAQRKKYAVSNYQSSQIPAGDKVYSIDQIRKILPHRYPFLLVDRVIEIESGKKGIGIKNVTINDNFFQGHFPSKPVMPGVLMIEAIAQTAGVVLLTGGTHDGKVALFMAINEVKFRKIVVPGDQLLMEIEIIRDRERTAHVKGVGKVDGEIAVEAEMMFSYTEATYLYG